MGSPGRLGTKTLDNAVLAAIAGLQTTGNLHNHQRATIFLDPHQSFGWRKCIKALDGAKAEGKMQNAKCKMQNEQHLDIAGVLLSCVHPPAAGTRPCCSQR